MEAAYYPVKFSEEWKLCDWEAQKEETVEWTVTKLSHSEAQSEANDRRAAPSIYRNQKGNRRSLTDAHTDTEFCVLNTFIWNTILFSNSISVLIYFLYKEGDLTTQQHPPPTLTLTLASRRHFTHTSTFTVNILYILTCFFRYY